MILWILYTLIFICCYLIVGLVWCATLIILDILDPDGYYLLPIFFWPYQMLTLFIYGIVRLVKKGCWKYQK